MQNKLKPCPFCGGEATLNKYGYRYINCPDCFAMTGSTGDVDRLVDNWNTRQPAFDWKPIEELTEDEFLTESHLLFYNNQNDELPYHTGFRYSNFIDAGCILEKIWIHGDSYNFKEISAQYTHYALLTPPQTNQS